MHKEVFIKVLDVMPEDKIIGNTTVGELAGHLINVALGPYLIAVGTVALEPIGALLGGLVAGMISYGLAEGIIDLSWYIGEDSLNKKLYFYLRLVTLIQTFGLSLVILKNKGC